MFGRAATAHPQIPAPPSGSADDPHGQAAAPSQAPASGPGRAFVVKLRAARTCSWGNETEIVAASALDAAQLVAGEPLFGGRGERANLRARVWQTPYGSVPDQLFYVKGTP